MNGVVISVGIFELILGGMALFAFIVEYERLPGTWRRWTPYITGISDRYRVLNDDGGLIQVGVRRKNDRVPMATLDPREDAFAEKLAAAESQARARCLALNASHRTLLRRRRPR